MLRYRQQEANSFRMRWRFDLVQTTVWLACTRYAHEANVTEEAPNCKSQNSIRPIFLNIYRLTTGIKRKIFCHPQLRFSPHSAPEKAPNKSNRIAVVKRNLYLCRPRWYYSSVGEQRIENPCVPGSTGTRKAILLAFLFPVVP